MDSKQLNKKKKRCKGVLGEFGEHRWGFKKKYRKPERDWRTHLQVLDSGPKSLSLSGQGHGGE